MKIIAHPRLIGLFVLFGLLLFVILVILWGSGGFLSTTPRYAIYFGGSVNGLTPGAMVKLRGVTVGKVLEVKVRYQLDSSQLLTPVVAEIDLAKVIEAPHSNPVDLPSLIRRGLRARLAVQSLVTNQLYVDLAFLPDSAATLRGPVGAIPTEIPTVTSGKEELEKSLEYVAREVRELPVRETLEATLHVLNRIDQLLAKPETSGSIERLNARLDELGPVLRRLDTLTLTSDQIAKQVRAQLPSLLEEAGATLRQTRQSMASLSAYTEPDSELSAALKDLAEAARSMRHLADALERHPDAFLYGRKAQEVPAAR